MTACAPSSNIRWIANSRSNRSTTNAVRTTKTFAARGPTIRPPRCCNTQPFGKRNPSMLNQPTIEKLQMMKLHGMVQALREQLESPPTHQLSFEERFGLLVDQQWLWKENRALARRLQS